MKTDIEIAKENKMLNIKDIANNLDLKEEDYECYGNYKAKINFENIKDQNKKQNLILVTAINPTKAGEGKSTTTIALADALKYLNKDVIACLREPSLGPVFGLKGGATGGGYSQVVPMEDINLHFTGDIHAITSANNLVAALLDNHIYQGNELNIDPTKIVWKRCIDMNDRTLRDITIGQKKKNNGIEREDHFCITVATETMAVFCLADNLKDFMHKISNAIVAYAYDDKPIYLKDLKCEGALAILLKEAIKPNLVQTLEHTPVLIHGGPFANIAHGCNSIIATKLGLKLCDYVITEAGFGADLGAEKFFDIKARKANLKPKAVVLVATCRALKLHGGILEDKINIEDLEALNKGLDNLEKHLESLNNYQIPIVIAINKFASDSEKELSFLTSWCQNKGYEVSICEGYNKGSIGTIDLGNKVIKACEKENHFNYLYDDNEEIENKIKIICQKIYGADDIIYSDKAKEKLEKYKIYKNLPICMAKTPLSLSDDPKLVGRPTGFKIHVEDLSISLGAGFIVVYTGSIMTLPGLPKKPAALNMKIDEENNIYGLF